MVPNLLDTGPLVALADLTSSGLLDVADFPKRDLKAKWEYMSKFRDVPCDFADATLLALAERLGIHQIVSLDRHFYAYRIGDHRITILPYGRALAFPHCRCDDRGNKVNRLYKEAMNRLKWIMFSSQAVISVIWAVVMTVLWRADPAQLPHPNLSFYQENLQEDQWGNRFIGAILLFILASGMLALVFALLMRRENNKLTLRHGATQGVQP